MRPTRYLETPSVRAIYGRRVDQLGDALSRTDPLADAVVLAFRELPRGAGWAQVERALTHGLASVEQPHPAISALFQQVETVPPWVDLADLDGAGDLLMRAGQFGGLVLGLSSLPYGYASPAGNKPLAFSGRLTEQAPRRLMETARFVHAVSQRNAMVRGHDGYAIALKVRLMHATVRRLLWDSGRWQPDAWGAPINQHDQVATTLLFSVIVIEGLRKLGFRISAKEAERFVQLWRYVGWLMGTELELLPSSEADALRLGDLILTTQAEPDDDSRALTTALLDFGLKGARSTWEQRRVKLTQPVTYAISRHLLGDRLATALGVPESRASAFLPVITSSVTSLERLRRVSSRANAVAVKQGDWSWRRVIEDGLRGQPAQFHPPGQLSR